MQNQRTNELFDKLKNGLIVSCQAAGNSPFNSPEGVTLFAQAALMGGAVGIRSEGFEKTKMIKSKVNLPVIGLIKSEFPDGYVRITGSFDDIDKLIEAGSDVIAIDGTFRKREELSGPDFIGKVKSKYHMTVMADIAEYDEGIACVESGADCLSTTLSGYTPSTASLKQAGPNLELLERLAADVIVPVFAEGRINSPEEAAKMISAGAWGVVVGSAITRPNVVTQWYVDAIKSVIK